MASEFIAAGYSGLRAGMRRSEATRSPAVLVFVAAKIPGRAAGTQIASLYGFHSKPAFPSPADLRSDPRAS